MERKKMFRKKSLRLKASLAILLFGMPFIFLTQYFFSLNRNSFLILGLKFTHNDISNQSFVWTFITFFVAIVYYTLWLILSKSKVRLCVFFPFAIYSYFFSRSLWEYFKIFDTDFAVNTICIIILFTGFIVVRKSKQILTRTENFLELTFSSGLILVCTLYFSSSYNFLDKPNIIINDFTISNFGFNSIGNFILYSSLKLLIIIPLIYWFLTETNWWKYALLSPILIFSMQLYNSVILQSEVVDEIEVLQTLHFTIPLFIILILLAKANENQEKIGYWLASQYKLVENSLISKFSDKEVFINDKRKELAKSKLKIEDLEKIKTELEQELKSAK